MTGWSVVVARTAERDLTEAVLYIKDRLGNQAAALRLLDEFERIVADIAAKRGTDDQRGWYRM